MTLDQLPKAKTEKINSSKANSFLHKGAKYKLFGAFFSATMHKGYSSCQPTFEVSIGTNVYDPRDEAERSAFYKPKSDIDHYYSLKWKGQPIIQVNYPLSLSLSLLVFLLLLLLLLFSKLFLFPELLSLFFH